MQKYWKVYNGYQGMDEVDYKSLAEAEDGAKIFASASNNRMKHPTIIFEAVGKVKIPVPAMEIEKFA